MKNLKILASEHVQSKELAWVEVEKEIMTRDLIDRNNEVVVLNRSERASCRERVSSPV